MSWLENRTVRMFVMAAGGAVMVLLLRELAVMLLGEVGKGGANLVAEVMDPKILFTRMMIFFLGMAMAAVAFGKQGQWKMLVAIVFLSAVMRPLEGGALGALDRVLLLVGLGAVLVNELDGAIAKVIGTVVCAIAVILLGVDDFAPFRRNPIATFGILALITAPTIFLTNFVMAGELTFAPLRRMVAKARA
jgi:hypothetical protein